MDSSAHNAVAAAFSDREIAHACYEALEREGFPHRWMAVTKPADNEAWGDGSAETTSENDIVESSDGALGAIGRFFSGEGNSLRRSLEDHGIDTDEAMEIDEALHLGGAVVVVAGHERSEIAASILRAGGGRFYGARARSSAVYDVATDSLVTPATVPVPPAAAVAAPGANVAAVQTLELREERLEIDKRRVSAGEATVGSRVVSEPVSVDVPVAHEELFIERHAVDGSRSASGSIGDDETIVVPLQREEVVVEKTPFVREEVIVGQRRVEGVEHVRETLLHEELEVEPARRPTP
jgi:uncharacterized protein (TIGR02271 family)